MSPATLSHINARQLDLRLLTAIEEEAHYTSLLRQGHAPVLTAKYSRRWANEITAIRAEINRRAS